MNDPETTHEADVIPMPREAKEEHQIPVAIAAELRKFNGSILELTGRLGRARSEYLVTEAHLMTELSQAQRSFSAGAKAALLSLGIEAKPDESWDLDIAAGTMRKAT